MSWSDLTDSSQRAMRDHATNSPGCADGEITARTFRDNRENPPKVTQDLSCDTCRQRL